MRRVVSLYYLSCSSSVSMLIILFMYRSTYQATNVAHSCSSLCITMHTYKSTRIIYLNIPSALTSTNLRMNYSCSQVQSNFTIPKKLAHEAVIQDTPCQSFTPNEIESYLSPIKSASTSKNVLISNDHTSCRLSLASAGY